VFLQIAAALVHNSEKLITRLGRYDPIRNVRLISGYPILQGCKSSVAGGMLCYVVNTALRAAVARRQIASPTELLSLSKRPSYGLPVSPPSPFFPYIVNGTRR
jgi:hypothetical protein